MPRWRGLPSGVPMDSSALSKLAPDVQPPPRPSGVVCQFTRHPRALARSITLEMRAAARFVLEVLLTFADAEGVCWPSPRQIAQVTPRSGKVKRYSLPTVLRSLRELEAAGLLESRRVAPGHRYPAREGKGASARTVWNQGLSTHSGGRVFVVNLAAFHTAGGKPPSHDRSITSDRSGSITHDRPSDRPSDPSKYKKDPARPALTEDTRPSDAPTESDVRGLAPAGSEASETPRTRALRAGALRQLAGAGDEDGAGREREAMGEGEQSTRHAILAYARAQLDGILGPEWRKR